MSRRSRLDVEMVRRGLAVSRAAARERIEAGAVVVDGVAAPKPASQVLPDQPITLVEDGPRFASRGGLKLQGALEDLDVDVAGLTALDAGAAHGGFTDVLLRRGVAHVVAVDVAYGQLAWHLRTDERVTLLERTNVRTLAPEDVGRHRPHLVVADLSFISLRKVLPALALVALPDAQMLPMVKPQFEVGAAGVGKGGVVRDPDRWAEAISDVARAAAALGLRTLGAAPSRAPGPAGNIEFFLHLRRTDPPAEPPDLDDDVRAHISAAVAAGEALARRGPQAP